MGDGEEDADEGLAALGDLLNMGDALSRTPPSTPANAEPGNADFAATEPAATEPGNAKPGDADFTAPEPGAAEPGSAEPATAWPQPMVSSTDATASATTIGRAIRTTPLP
ncbi:hypothetical protein GCM10009555_000190 [Acrocarpospora macrocephala]|uniref:Uncharacterized protein n=1 Tax=Acrocarpospora macrocephala TaxID=150177 RepID=A0A5M3WTM6_9ACTN|nr:hypothetical protein Amac_052090 [Acrocarpospora macrocephala]